MPPTATTVPVEQDSSAARLEAAEQLPETLDPESLRKYFTLTETDLQEVAVCRGVVNKLGFAVQLCTLRWQGYFLGDTRGLPATVLETLARQLGLLAMSIDDYPQNEKTRWEHLEPIRQHLRFQQCDDFQRQRLLKHLTETAQALPRSDALRQEAWRWLQGQRIVRPGRTTLRDLLTAAREGSLQHAFALLARGLTAEQREQLDALLVVPSGGDVETQAGVVTEFWSRSGLEQYMPLRAKNHLRPCCRCWIDSPPSSSAAWRRCPPSRRSTRPPAGFWPTGVTITRSGASDALRPLNATPSCCVSCGPP